MQIDKNINYSRALNSLLSVLGILLFMYITSCVVREYCSCGSCKKIMGDNFYRQFNYFMISVSVGLLIIAALTQQYAINQLIKLGICSSQCNIPLLLLLIFLTSGMPGNKDNILPKHDEHTRTHNFTSVLQFQVVFIPISYFFIDFKLIAITIQIYIIIKFLGRSRKTKID